MKKFKRPTKAIIPVAGFSTRFLPQTKAIPKTMLPLVDKPIIQYLVESLVEAGIKDIIIVTGYHLRAIEDHFDEPHQDLINNLLMGGEKKKHLIEEVKRISNLANFVYLRQKGPYGNGTPLLNVAPLVKDEPFIYTWSDDMILSTPSEYEQLINAYEKYGVTCLSAVRAKEDKDYNKYGYIGGTEIEDGIIDVSTMIEKPGREKAPSDLATVSGFLLTPDVFNYTDKTLSLLQNGNELYYNDILNEMLNDGQRVLGVEIKGGKFLDFGNKLGYMKAVFEFAKKDKDIGEEFSKWLQEENM